MGKDNTNSISYACSVLAQAIRETPEISGLFTGVPVYVYSEVDEDFAAKLEATINQGTGIAVWVRSDGWGELAFRGDSVIASAQFTVRIIASLLLNSSFAKSTTDLAVAIVKNCKGVFGDERFRSGFVPGAMSVFESAGTITRELKFSATLEI